ncbi:hypothetical protein [Streptomyces pseudovenezuelae]|uniref:hypothetical protein n=1 Tax=Streptomyces pseudovenezuelae TaxID=67350 RepID=UPI0036EBDBC7
MYQHMSAATAVVQALDAEGMPVNSTAYMGTKKDGWHLNAILDDGTSVRVDLDAERRNATVAVGDGAPERLRLSSADWWIQAGRIALVAKRARAQQQDPEPDSRT